MGQIAQTLGSCGKWPRTSEPFAGVWYLRTASKRSRSHRGARFAVGHRRAGAVVIVAGACLWWARGCQWVAALVVLLGGTGEQTLWSATKGHLAHDSPERFGTLNPGEPLFLTVLQRKRRCLATDAITTDAVTRSHTLAWQRCVWYTRKTRNN